MVENKIVVARGCYLTGVGQESRMYYFKFDSQTPLDATLKKGDVCWSFYQGNDYVVPVPAMVRVDEVFRAEARVKSLLRQEDELGYPLLPLISIIDHFDPRNYGDIVAAEKRYAKEMELFSVEQPAYRGVSGDRRVFIYSKANEMAQDGMSAQEIADYLDVSRSTIQRYLKGDLNQVLKKTVRKTRIKQYRNRILEMLYQNPNAKSMYIYKQLMQEPGFDVSYRTTQRYVAQLRINNGIPKQA